MSFHHGKVTQKMAWIVCFRLKIVIFASKTNRYEKKNHFYCRFDEPSFAAQLMCIP